MTLRFHQSPGIESAPLQDEVILFHASSKKFCVLNRTSSLIWSRLTEPVTAEDLARDVANSFRGVTLIEAVRDVNSMIEKMLLLGLIVTSSTPEQRPLKEVTK